MVCQLFFFMIYGTFTGVLINQVKKDYTEIGYTDAFFEMSLEELSNRVVRKT